MLRLEGVRVSLDGAEVVRGIDIRLDDGEWLGLIGPNGAGKTTVLRAVAGLVPYSGSVRIVGDEASALRRRELARRVAVVPQIPVIPPDTSVLEYVVLGRTPHLGYSGSPGPATSPRRARRSHGSTRRISSTAASAR